MDSKRVGKIISNVHVVDTKNCTVREGYDIHISGRKISDVCPHVPRSHGSNEDLEVIDATGSWALPGLIESHCHVTEIHEGMGAGELPDGNLEDALARARENISNAMRIGVTTLRDMAAFDARNNIIRNELKAGRLGHGRLISCGHHITVHGGHFYKRGVSWERAKQSLTELVNSVIDDGADFIKVMNDDPIFSEAEMQEIVIAAHERGLPVACHAFTESQICEAIEIGANTIEHAFPPSERALKSIVDKGVFLCPTVVAAVDALREDCTADVLAHTPDCTLNEFRTWHHNLEANLPRAFEAGVKVIAGTDAGSFPTPFDSLQRELEIFSNLGADPWQCVRSATLFAAQALQIDSQLGVIAKGMLADVVLTRVDPLSDFAECLDGITGVFFEGVRVI